MQATNADWYKAQVATKAWLNGYGIKTLSADYYAPFDLYTPRGTRIEIKFSPLGTRGKGIYKVPSWQFNIHRHGKVNNQCVDFYVLICESTPATVAVGMRAPVYLVLRAPIKSSTVLISFRSMLIKWGRFANLIEPLVEFDESLKEADTARTFEQAHPVHPSSVCAREHRRKP